MEKERQTQRVKLAARESGQQVLGDGEKQTAGNRAREKLGKREYGEKQKFRARQTERERVMEREANGKK